MNVLSLFDGMSCGQIALNRAGIKYDNYYASEINKYAISVTNKNYPNTKQLGDVEKWETWNLEKIDIILAGSPCQNLSFAGDGTGLEGNKSRLFYTFVDILKYYKPKYFLLENVKMKKEWRDTISTMLGIDFVEINSALVSGQSRKRLYWTNIERVSLPEDKNIKLSDILVDKDDIDEKYFYDKSGMDYMNRRVRDGRSHWDFGHHSDTKKDKSSCLTMERDDSIPYNVLIDRRFDENGKVIRMFLPVEYERLQTVPDKYTYCLVGNKPISDNQRYKLIGNAWTVDIIVHILKNIAS